MLSLVCMFPTESPQLPDLYQFKRCQFPRTQYERIVSVRLRRKILVSSDPPLLICPCVMSWKPLTTCLMYDFSVNSKTRNSERL